MTLELECTCTACPEQYDVRADGKMAGYIRLRRGVLYVHCPDVGGETVLYHQFDGDLWKGEFDCDDERSEWLDKAKAAIEGWLTRQPATTNVVTMRDWLRDHI